MYIEEPGGIGSSSLVRDNHLDYFQLLVRREFVPAPADAPFALCS